MGYPEGLVSQVGGALLATTAATVVALPLAYRIALSTSSGLARLSLRWTERASPLLVAGAWGAIFLVVLGIPLAWWLGNTAYRKTIPAVLQLIQIRHMREIEARLGQA